MDKKSQPNYVYLIEAETKYKIGFSNDPIRRLKQLQKTEQESLILRICVYSVQARTLEQKIHKELPDYHLNGEWFSKNKSSLSQAIELLLKGDFPKTPIEISMEIFDKTLFALGKRHEST